jgi:hypothetical protein
MNPFGAVVDGFGGCDGAACMLIYAVRPTEGRHFKNGAEFSRTRLRLLKRADGGLACSKAMGAVRRLVLSPLAWVTAGRCADLDTSFSGKEPASVCLSHLPNLPPHRRL